MTGGRYEKLNCIRCVFGSHSCVRCLFLQIVFILAQLVWFVIRGKYFCYIYFGLIYIYMNIYVRIYKNDFIYCSLLLGFSITIWRVGLMSNVFKSMTYNRQRISPTVPDRSQEDTLPEKEMKISSEGLLTLFPKVNIFLILLPFIHIYIYILFLIL